MSSRIIRARDKLRDQHRLRAPEVTPVLKGQFLTLHAAHGDAQISLWIWHGRYACCLISSHYYVLIETVLDRSLPFEDLKQRGHINALGRAADQAPDFSRRIRAGLP